MNDNQPHNVKENVLEKIRHGEVKMRPKAYFMAVSAVVVLGVLIAATFAVFLVSFVSFILRRSGVLYTSSFGTRGLVVLLSTTPWVLIAASFLMILAVDYLVRKHSFAYKRPVLITLIGIFVIVIVAGLGVARTNFHRTLLDRADRGTLPFFGAIYRGYGHHLSGEVFTGSVSSIEADGFILQSADGEAYDVFFASSTMFPLGNLFEDGDLVTVMGQASGTFIRAFGIREVNDPEVKFFGPPPQMRHRHPHMMNQNEIMAAPAL